MVMITCRDRRLKLRIKISILVFERTFESKVYGLSVRKFSCFGFKKKNIDVIRETSFNPSSSSSYQIDGGQLLSYELAFKFHD